MQTFSSGNRYTRKLFFLSSVFRIEVILFCEGYFSRSFCKQTHFSFWVERIGRNSSISQNKTTKWRQTKKKKTEEYRARMSSLSEKVVFDDQDDDKSSVASISHDDSTPTTNFREREEPDQRKEVEKYSSQESKDVCTWKFLVIMLIVVVGSFASATTLKFIQDVEHDEFVNEVRVFKVSNRYSTDSCSFESWTRTHSSHHVQFFSLNIIHRNFTMICNSDTKVYFMKWPSSLDGFRHRHNHLNKVFRMLRSQHLKLRHNPYVQGPGSSL